MPRRSPGEGTVTEWGKRGPNSAYRARITITLPTGKRKTIYGYGPTAKAAIAERSRKVKEAKTCNPSGQTMTVDEVFARLMTAKKVGGRKRKTLHENISNYRRHVQPRFGHERIKDVRLEQLQAIQADLVRDGKYRTAELVTILLKEIWRHAMKIYRAEVRHGELRLINLGDDLEPIRRPASAKSKPPVLWSGAQLQAFLKESEHRYHASMRSLYHPLFYTAIAAGLRRGELLGLRWEDLERNGERAYLNIVRQLNHYAGDWHEDTPKREASERRVPIDIQHVGLLMQHHERLELIEQRGGTPFEQGLMFPTRTGMPFQPGELYGYERDIIRQLGLPDATLHTLRKVYATYLTRELIRQGRYSPKLVAGLLGHSTQDTAMKIYTLVIEEDYDAAIFNPNEMKES